MVLETVTSGSATVTGRTGAPVGRRVTDHRCVLWSRIIRGAWNSNLVVAMWRSEGLVSVRMRRRQPCVAPITQRPD